MPRSFNLGSRDELVDRIKLVVAREDDRLSLDRACALRILDLVFAGLGEDVRADDVEESLALQHLSPEVVCPVAVGHRRIAVPTLDTAGITTAVEGKKARLLPVKPSRHVNLVGVCGEVDEGALLKAEDRRVGIAILLVLPDGALPSLAGHRILELAGRNGHPVEREQQVDLVPLPRMTARLPRHAQLVALESGQRLVVEPVRRLEVREPKDLTVELEPVTQNVQRTLRIELFHQRLDDS